MSLRCTACPATVDYGVEFCHTCREVINDYNRDIIDKESDEVFVDDNGEDIIP